MRDNEDYQRTVGAMLAGTRDAKLLALGDRAITGDAEVLRHEYMLANELASWMDGQIKAIENVLNKNDVGSKV